MPKGSSIKKPERLAMETRVAEECNRAYFRCAKGYAAKTQSSQECELQNWIPEKECRSTKQTGHGILAFARCRSEVQEFKVMFSYTVSTKSHWVTQVPILKMKMK